MFAICLVAAFLTSQSEADADITINPPAIDVEAGSADRLAETLIRQHDALTAISLVYTSVPRSRKGEPEGGYWRRAISVSSAGMFKSDNSHGHLRRPWRVDSKRKALVIAPMESTLLENVNRCVRAFPFTDTGKAPAVLRNEEIIFDVLCWWPFTNWPPPEVYGHAYSMRTLLNEKSYRLLPERQLVGSRPCYTLVVNDMVTVWCDCDRPECVLKSERYNPRSQAIDSRFEMMEYEEMGDRIWLPKKFRIVRFDSQAHTARLREKVVQDMTFVVSEIKINDAVDLSCFRQEYAPGTVREIRLPKEIRYEAVVDGELDHFKSILSWCRAVASEATAKMSRRWYDRLLMFVLFFLVGCSVVVALERSVQQRRALLRIVREGASTE